MVCARAFVMPTRNVEETTKLKALRAAAQLGISALDRGEFKEFTDASALVAHLNELAIASLPDRRAIGHAPR
jgi:antitoxin ParD1/3/4